ncbi:MAG: 50S ribosomal protein L24 [Candidatus Dormiibacterota bacterium]
MRRREASNVTRHGKPLEIRSGDTVVVISGAERGKRGVVQRTYAIRRRIVVEGVNIRKRHQRSGQQRGGTAALQGGVIDFPAPFDYSNVQLVCPKCDSPTRLGHRVDGEHMVPFCKRCGEAYLRAPRA